jgi:DNA-binding MarR family transcriptional regulator
MAVKAAAKRKPGKAEKAEELNVGWHPGERVLHGLLLEAILKDNPIPLAYRMNYIANFYVGPLVAMMEKSFKLTRSEWIVLFCLTRQPRLNAQQISIVTGRPKTSIAGAVKLLQKKGLITRKTDIADSRRRVLHLSESGQRTYASIIGNFIERERGMLAALDPAEQRELVRLFGKIIAAADAWAKPY